jgi:radical SAM-linked protein
MMRVRALYHKSEAMRYTGHLDVYRAWERLIRRSELPLIYSQGFSPHPKINLSPALPLGFTSECELIDIWLERYMPLLAIEERLKMAAPPGILIQHVESIELSQAALQNQILSSVYLVNILESVSQLETEISRIEQASELIRTRRSKKYDLRPLIEKIHLLPPSVDGYLVIMMQLSCREGSTGRPEEVLAEMGYPANKARVTRKKFLAEDVLVHVP